jgi:hypothetical protein
VEELEEQAVEPAVDVPVDVAQVVALGVVAVVGELRPGAAPLGPLLALGAAGEEPPHDQLEVVELRDQRRVQQRSSSFGFTKTQAKKILWDSTELSGSCLCVEIISL